MPSYMIDVVADSNVNTTDPKLIDVPATVPTTALP